MSRLHLQTIGFVAIEIRREVLVRSAKEQGFSGQMAARRSQTTPQTGKTPGIVGKYHAVTYQG